MSNVVSKMHSIQQEIPLSKTTKFVVDNRGRTAPTEKAGIPLIATNCISNNNLYPVYENLRYVSQETYDNWFRSHPEPGDLLLTLKGSQNGAVCLVPDPVNFVIAQDMVALRVDEKVIDPLFLFAALRTDEVQAQIKNLDVSGVIPHLKKSDFDKLMLPYPERDTQHSIGQFYFYTSKKIDLLHRQNKTLEAMAETLFRQWFVEEAQEDWMLEKLGDCVTISYGKNLPTKNLFAEGFPVFGANGQIGFYERYTYEDPQVLVSCRGEASGKVNISLPKSFVTNNSLALERNKRPEISFEFLKYWALSYDFNLHVSGSAQPQITIDGLYDAEFIFPDVEVISRFTNAVKSAEEKRYTNVLQIRTLETLRDTLLPKLMSGEVRVTYA